ncbi:PREDICTED: DLA class II histocompatibility antigen, DR-1 beta chain-like [Crocodylus porosus]|uniref:DLA class II histocompatibility antigen, DR-1 beta chain-like n=1 Tax=Crocodylus porosus TaxID=8502 RepID=UPI00093EA1A0|nr:PREDICTED: DLA class II histocompatibility antigen, DR-1 beta chain-like [Crocodylus porosus]
MVSAEIAGTSCTGALIVIIALRFNKAHCTEPPEHFLLQENHECHYTNGTQQARYVERVIWGRQEICYYDSHVGYYVARTKEGRPIAEYRNRLEYLSFLWASVEKFCSYSYRRFKSLAMDRKVKPKIKIYPMKTESSHTPDLLVCSVTKFYPADIGVKWLKNGQEHTGKVVARELLPNGDWTFQMHVKLEMVPRRGDVYACQVDHISLQTPMILQWEVQTYSAKSKMIVGIVSLILGLIIIVTGLVLYLKNGEGCPWPAAAQSRDAGMQSAISTTHLLEDCS